MSAPKLRQTLLVIDNGMVDPHLLQHSVVEKLLEKDILLTLVIAADGAKGSTKFANQKFDAVIVNASVPRIQESGLQSSIDSEKSGFCGPVYVIGVTDQTPGFRFKHGKNFKQPLDPQALVSALIEDLGKPLRAGSAPGAYAVDVRVINAIITSALKVLGQFEVKNIVMGKPGPRSLSEPMAGVISSVLEIKSVNFRGQLSISFDEKSFLEMVSGMLCEEQTSITDDNRDAVGEINNIIFGNAKPDLATYGVLLTIPKVVLGSGQLMVCPAGSAALRVPFQTAKGRFYLDLIAYPLED